MYTGFVVERNNQPVRLRKGARITVIRCEVRVHVRKPGARGQLIPCVLRGIEKLEFSKQSDALLAVKLMLQALQLEFEQIDEPQHDRVFFEVGRLMPWPVETVKKPRFVVKPMLRADADLITKLRAEFVQVHDLSVRLMNALTTGTPTRPGAELTHVWELTRHERTWFDQYLRDHRSRTEFDELMVTLGLQHGQDLPAGDYPWNG